MTKSKRPEIEKHIDLSNQLTAHETFQNAVKFNISRFNDRKFPLQIDSFFTLIACWHWGYSTPKTHPNILLKEIPDKTQQLLEYRSRDPDTLLFLSALTSAAFAGSLMSDDAVLGAIGEWMDTKPTERESCIPDLPANSI